jgi:hypothetical protein
LGDGRPLHTWRRTEGLQIMVPRYAKKAKSRVFVAISGHPFPALSGQPFAQPYEINWDDVTPEPLFANEQVYIARKPFVLISLKIATVTDPRPEAGQKTLAPQTLPAFTVNPE